MIGYIETTTDYQKNDTRGVWGCKQGIHKARYEIQIYVCYKVEDRENKGI